MKGVSEIQFIMTYTAFLVFIAYVSGLVGITIIQNLPETPTGFNEPSVLDILAPFQYFLALLTLNIVPEFAPIMGLLVSPLIAVLIYVIIKALPFT